MNRGFWFLILPHVFLTIWVLRAGAQFLFMSSGVGSGILSAGGQRGLTKFSTGRGGFKKPFLTEKVPFPSLLHSRF